MEGSKKKKPVRSKNLCDTKYSDRSSFSILAQAPSALLLQPQSHRVRSLEPGRSISTAGHDRQSSAERVSVCLCVLPSGRKQQEVTSKKKGTVRNVALQRQKSTGQSRGRARQKGLLPQNAPRCPVSSPCDSQPVRRRGKAERYPGLPFPGPWSRLGSWVEQTIEQTSQKGKKPSSFEEQHPPYRYMIDRFLHHR